MEQYAELATAVRAAKNTHGPFAAVTIIVPTLGGALDVTRHLARALSDLGGLVNVVAANLPSLADELFLDSAETRGRREVTPLLREASARASLSQHPGLFGKLAARQATVQAVARTSETLDGISAEHLATLETTPLLGEILAHHQSIRQALESTSYFPDEVLRVAATRLGEPAVRSKLGTVIVFCLPAPQGLLEREFLEAIKRTLTPQRITSDAESSTGPDADTGSGTGTGSRTNADSELITGAELISMTDADEEARAIARLVAEELATGTLGHRIGIFLPASTPYGALLARHLTHAGIAWTGAAPRQLIDTSVARNLLRFLDADTENFDFRLVLDAMAERALLPQGKDFPTPAQAERIYRHTARDDDEETERTTAWQQKDAERRQRFRAYVAELAAELDDARNASTWLQAANSLQKLVNDHFSPTKSGPVFTSTGGAGGAGGSAGGGSFENPVIWREQLALAISSLGTLDGLAPAPSPKAIREQLEAAITSRPLRHGKMGSGVLIASLSSGPARDLDLVIVCGLAEGIAPPRVYENPLLPDSVIEALGSPVPTSLNQVDALRQDFLQTLRSGARRRVLTYPRGDLRGGGLRVLSRWVSTAYASAEHIRPLVVGSFQEGMLTGSPTGMTRSGDGSSGTDTDTNSGSGPIAVTEQARAVASFRANPHLLEAVDPDSDLGASLALRRDRRRGVFSRFNGNLSSVAEFIDVLDRPISPTSIEMYRKTPLSYFLQHVLRARALNDVVQSPELDSLVRGTLIHEILEHWILDYLAGAHTGDVASLILQAETTSARFKEEVGGFWIEQFWLIAKNEIFEDLRQWHTVNDEILADGWIPAGAEANFPTLTEGEETTPRLPTVDIDLVDGTGQLSFLGQIDRYDRQPDGSIHVIDYKGGKNKGFDSLSADNPTADGYKYQLAVYGRLAQMIVAEEGTDGSVRASYWFVRREDAKNPMVSIRMNDAVMKKLAEDLTVLAHDVRAGAFPPISGRFDTYSTMIGIERVDALWDRISASPELNSITTFWHEAPEAEELA